MILTNRKWGLVCVFCFGLITTIAYSKSSLQKTNLTSAKISWLYQNVPAKMEIYEPASQRPIKIWDMGTVRSPSQLPVDALIRDSVVQIRPGGSKLFILVMKNETQKPIHFFAAPHVVDPPAYSLGFKFKCLCVNHVYTIAPGEIWYRVVRLLLSPKFVGDSINVTHTLIGVSADRAESNFEMPEMDHEM